MTVGKFGGLFKDAVGVCGRHDVFQFSATLAYYTVVSLAPLVVFAVHLAGLVFGDGAARGRMVAQVQELVGPDGARGVEAVLENARGQSGLLATLLGVAALVGGLLFVFMHLRDSLNRLWGVRPKAGGVAPGKRVLSFALLLAIGFLLLVSLVLSAVLSSAYEWAGTWQPHLILFWQALHAALSLGLVAGLFALMFKYLPDADVAWKDVAVGGAVTALLFTAGKFLVGLYLGNSGIASAYGAAGSVVVVLVWLYYTGLILFYGAAVTRLYAERFGSSVRPSAEAERAVAPAAGPA